MPNFTKSQNLDSKNSHHTKQNEVYKKLQPLKANIESTCKELSMTTNAADSKQKPVNLPFEDESFEIVTLLAVLEHLNYPLEMLQEISRVLKPNGILLLTAPSHAAKPILEFLAFKLKIVSKEEILDHKRYFNAKDLKELISQIPTLEMLSHRYFQLGLNNFCKIKRLKKC